MENLENIINNKIQSNEQYRIKLDIEDFFKRVEKLKEKINKADDTKYLKVLLTFVHDMQNEYNKIINENKEILLQACDRFETVKNIKEQLDIMLL